MAEPTVERSFSEPHLALDCTCGWTGHDDDIEDWEVDQERDRVVRQCPACDRPVPEWGALEPIEAAAKIARGPLAEAIAESEYDAETESVPQSP